MGIVLTLTRVRGPWLRALAAVAALLATSAVLSACGAGPGKSGDGSRLSVVTSFYPIQEAAQRVGGSCVDVTSLTPPGVDPHDLELTPDDVVAIDQADLVFYLGGGFQPAVEDALGDATGTKVDLLRSIATLPPPNGEEGGLQVDPHVWLDPTRYSEMVASIADAMRTAGVRCDTAGNAQRFERQLKMLDAEYRAGLSTCARDLIVTTHDAFAYLADAYALRQVAISGISPEAEPDARHLAQLKDLVERDRVTTIFSEDLISPRVAQTLANEAGVTTAVLHTIEGLTPAQRAAGEDYRSQMRENLSTLEGALGCD